MNLNVRDSRLLALVDEDASLDVAASGFQFTEGPVWQPRDRSLLFSDIIGNTMYRWSQADGLSIFRRPSQMANGNTLDHQGRVLTCEHATSRVTRTDRNGRYEILASHYDGKELNSPNDIVVKRDGMVYFTDPTSGRTARYGVLRDQQLSFQGVYRLDPETKALTLLVDDFSKPNGLCFSLDETRLFINDTDRMHIRVFDVNADGTLGSGRVWAETVGEGVGRPDGMKIDVEGNLYCCGPGGIHVFDPDAHCLGVMCMPEHAANFQWGDDDRRSLYITASTSVYRLRMKLPGYSTV